MSLNSQKDENQSAEGIDLAGSSAVTGKVPPYEAPTVKRVGDLHELLAGGAGSTLETQDPFAQKMAGAPG